MKRYVAGFIVFALLVMFAGAAMAGNPMRGRPLYNEHCSGCHGVNGLPTVAEVPNFSMGEGLMKSDQDLEQVIKNGKSIMPGYAATLTDQQISDVIAHIRTFF